MPHIIDVRHSDGIYYPDILEYEPNLVEYLSEVEREEAERVLEEVGFQAYNDQGLYPSDVNSFLMEQNFTSVLIAGGETFKYAEAPLLKGIIEAKKAKLEDVS